MKRSLKQTVSFILIFVLLVSVIPVTHSADTYDFYGRSALLKLSDGEELCKAYDRIVECIENRRESVDLSDLHLDLSELRTVVTAYQNDPYDHFWVNTGYSYSYYSSSHIVDFIPTYNQLAGSTEAEFQSNRKAFDNAVAEIFSKINITASMSDYEKEKLIHDALALSVSYDKNASNAHNAYGAIVEKKAVCQGYTLAFQYLLRLAGIQAHFVAGTSRGEGHSWNLVYIDGAYYYTDITWDDPSGSTGNDPKQDLFYIYFNVTESQLSLDHSWEEPVYGLPSCTETRESFFSMNPQLKVSTNSSQKDIAALFQNGYARLYVDGSDYETFGEWFFENLEDIARLAGYDMTKEITASYSYSSREYHLIISGTLPEPDVALGDVDGDGKISSVDSNTLRRIISGLVIPTQTNKQGGDINFDSSLSGIDSNLLKRMLAGQ